MSVFSVKDVYLSRKGLKNWFLITPNKLTLEIRRLSADLILTYKILIDEMRNEENIFQMRKPEDP